MSRISRTAARCAVLLLLGGTGVVCTPAMAFEIEASVTNPSGGTKRVCQQVANPLSREKVGPYKVYKKLQDSDHPAAATQQAAAISAVLLVASAVVLVVLDLLQRRMARRG